MEPKSEISTKEDKICNAGKRLHHQKFVQTELLRSENIVYFWGLILLNQLTHLVVKLVFEIRGRVEYR